MQVGPLRKVTEINGYKWVSKIQLHGKMLQSKGEETIVSTNGYLLTNSFVVMTGKTLLKLMVVLRLKDLRIKKQKPHIKFKMLHLEEYLD